MRLAFTTLKGGTGKTTSATYTSAGLHARGGSVTAIDADSQGSAIAWAERADFPWLTVAMPTKTIHRQIQKLGRFDHLVIDTPPKEIGVVTSALRAADVAVVTVQPTFADMDQVRETIALAEDVQAMNDLKILCLLTRVVKNTRAQGQVREALEEAGLTVMTSEVYQSQALALSHGQPIRDLGVYGDVVDELIERVG